MEFNLLTSNLFDSYTSAVKELPLEKPDHIKKIEVPVDCFQWFL